MILLVGHRGSQFAAVIHVQVASDLHWYAVSVICALCVGVFLHLCLLRKLVYQCLRPT